MADTTTLPDLRARLSGISDDISARAAEFEEQRRLPEDVSRKLAETGVFRMLVPAHYGGLELSVREFAEELEYVSHVNCSAGWCCMIAASTGLNAAYMAPADAREVFADPDVITGGVFAPMGRAEDFGDHYVLSGRWNWASGSPNCDWLSGGAMILSDGELQRLSCGAPAARVMFFPRSEAVLHDTWHSMGLRGTGSGEISVSKIEVPKGRTVSLITDRPQVSGSLYIFPIFGLLAIGVASVALGNARAALDGFCTLARQKKSQGSSRVLAERNTVQAAYSRAEMSWRAARAYLFDEIDTLWDAAHEDGEISVEHRVALRAACTNAARNAADICRDVFELAGGSAVYESCDLQRRFRDAHTITQHITVAPATWEVAGRHMLGLPTDLTMI